jgi:hypothetical protein
MAIDEQRNDSWDQTVNEHNTMNEKDIVTVAVEAGSFKTLAAALEAGIGEEFVETALAELRAGRVAAQASAARGGAISRWPGPSAAAASWSGRGTAPPRRPGRSLASRPTPSATTSSAPPSGCSITRCPDAMALMLTLDELANR